MMNIYTTKIQAICQTTGELKTFTGPRINAISFEDAQHYCNNNGLGYCQVVGLLIAEMPFTDDGSIIDYDIINLN